MTANVGQIGNPQIFIIPSSKLRSYISNIKIGNDVPTEIKDIITKNKPRIETIQKFTKLDYLVTEDDKRLINSLNLSKDCFKESKKSSLNSSSTSKVKLSLQDLHWLYKYIETQNKSSDKKVYLHELMEDSEILLPKNEQIPRNEELDKRCQRLKEEQQNQEYKNMTRNVDNFKRILPEDTIGYQLRMMNQHLIAIFQFIVSVAAGFAFGFIGVELLVGSLDFGFRLLLGIICALIIALAELYFLAKKLNDL